MDDENIIYALNNSQHNIINNYFKINLLYIFNVDQILNMRNYIKYMNKNSEYYYLFKAENYFVYPYSFYRYKNKIKYYYRKTESNWSNISLIFCYHYFYNKFKTFYYVLKLFKDYRYHDLNLYVSTIELNEEFELFRYPKKFIFLLLI